MSAKSANEGQVLGGQCVDSIGQSSKWAQISLPLSPGSAFGCPFFEKGMVEGPSVLGGKGAQHTSLPIGQ